LPRNALLRMPVLVTTPAHAVLRAAPAVAGYHGSGIHTHFTCRLVTHDYLQRCHDLSLPHGYLLLPRTLYTRVLPTPPVGRTVLDSHLVPTPVRGLRLGYLLPTVYWLPFCTRFYTRWLRARCVLRYTYGFAAFCGWFATLVGTSRG